MQTKTVPPPSNDKTTPAPGHQQESVTKQQALGYKSGKSAAEALLRLQRTHGNRFVQRVIQAKLEVSHPGDPHEQEADQVADRIMSMPAESTQSVAQREAIPEEEKDKQELAQPVAVKRVPVSSDQMPLQEEEKEEEKPDQTITAARVEEDEEQNGVLPHAEEAVSAASDSTGQPLPSNLQRKFEQGLGVDLSAVRVHTGPRSIEASNAISARAYTTGSDIHFNQGQYDPESSEGQRLLAHEVTHTMQQTAGITSPQRTRKLQRQEAPDTNVVNMPEERISGKDPNVIHIPEDKLSANKADPETQQVMTNIAAARTRAIGYLETTKTEVMMAVDSFKSYAIVEIDGMDLDPSSTLDLVPVLVGAVGAVIGGAFPPAAFVGITAGLVVGGGKAIVAGGIKEEGGALKLGLKASVHSLSEEIKNAMSATIVRLNGRIPVQLNELAATDKGVWELLKIGSDRNIDTAVSMLGIRDPHQTSLHRNVLKAMMAAFGSWKGKATFQLGMTRSQKTISENVIDSELHGGLRNAQMAGEKEYLEKAEKMAEEHQFGPSK
ncbi:DUF4157 domain-containing protein [Nitrosospira sp. Is2]|uniref:eCIS core domain-containing protein n=1 Tax=Nitrosospira sp. Is2 TaxID=3080532 RepID=UPI00295416F6|nr:DUF4157 domain-containing protein [Nitrosospira sp. Is2]WON73524.1 DUF4157 domain-containing protein [Nitrosospira sp. Is2]